MLSNAASDREIVAALGGPKLVARELNHSELAVKKWGKQGIPWRYRLSVKQLAEKKRKKLPRDFLVERRFESQGSA